MNHPTPACAGRWELFDSTDVNDHRQARDLCHACPMINACRERLDRAVSDAHEGLKYGPRGTWAGVLIGPPVTATHRAQAEEAMFTEQEARDAHASYAAGFRDTRTVVGERVYQRRHKREQRYRKAAA